MRYSRRQFTRDTLVASLTYSILAMPLLAQSLGRSYTVRKGDTLSNIARRYQTTVTAIKRANNLTGDLIRIGQKITLPYTGASNTVDRLYAVRQQCAGVKVRKGHWQRIVVHHSAIKYGNATKYDATHRRRGMKNGLAYHFVIGNGIDSGDGEIEVGPRWKKQLLGGHLKSYTLNLSSIGICLVGNFEESHPSQKQLDSFTQLMNWLQESVLKRKVDFSGHRELKGEQTVCPGKNFPLSVMHRRFG